MVITKTLCVMLVMSMVILTSSQDGRMLATTVTPTVLASSSTSSSSPQLVTLSGGKVVSAWISAGSSIVVKSYDAFGTEIATLKTITPPSSAYTYNAVALAALQSDKFVVVYELKFSAQSSTIYFQILNLSGSVIVTETVAFSAFILSGTLGKLVPEVAGLSNGNFAITFLVPQALLSPSLPASIQMNVFSSSGSPLFGNTVTVNDNTLSGSNNYPSIAALSDGGFVITYHNTFGTTYPQIYTKIYTNSGTSTISTIKVAQTSNTINTNPYVVALKSSGFMIAWQGGSSSSSYSYIYSGKFTSYGAELNSNYALSMDSRAYNPTLVVASNGMIIAAWAHIPSSGSSYSIYLTSWDSTFSSYTYVYSETAYTKTYYPGSSSYLALTPVSNGFLGIYAGTTTVGSSSYGIYGYAFSNTGSQAYFSGSCLGASDCTGLSMTCSYPSRTCSTSSSSTTGTSCTYSTDCGYDQYCNINYICQSYSSLTGYNDYSNSVISASVKLLWWVIMLIVLGAIVCLVITGCVIWKICKRPSPRLTVVKASTNPAPTTVAYVASPPPQVYTIPQSQPVTYENNPVYYGNAQPYDAGAMNVQVNMAQPQGYDNMYGNPQQYNVGAQMNPNMYSGNYYNNGFQQYGAVQPQ